MFALLALPVTVVVARAWDTPLPHAVESAGMAARTVIVVTAGGERKISGLSGLLGASWAAMCKQ